MKNKHDDTRQKSLRNNQHDDIRQLDVGNQHDLITRNSTTSTHSKKAVSPKDAVTRKHTDPTQGSQDTQDTQGSQGSQGSAWKEVIKEYFLPFLQFYFPWMVQEIDFHQPLIFLDKECKKLFSRSTSRNRYADLLVQVSTRTGIPPRLYIHIEVQGKKEQNFTKRLFTYASRIFDRVGEFPASLILLTDSDRNYKPTIYEVTNFGNSLRVEFQLAKLINFEDKREEMERSTNLFAVITGMQLEEMALKQRLQHSRKKPGEQVNERYELKKRLLKKLLQEDLLRKELDNDQTASLFKFLDWLVPLPPVREKQLIDEVDAETGGGTMAYVTSWERLGVKKGKLEGKLEGKREVLLRLLSLKFTLGPEEQQKITRADNAVKLNQALDRIIFASSLDDVLKELD